MNLRNLLKTKSYVVQSRKEKLLKLGLNLFFDSCAFWVFFRVDSKLCSSYIVSSEAMQFIYKPGAIIFKKAGNVFEM